MSTCSRRSDSRSTGAGLIPAAIESSDARSFGNCGRHSTRWLLESARHLWIWRRNGVSTCSCTICLAIRCSTCDIRLQANRMQWKANGQANRSAHKNSTGPNRGNPRLGPSSIFATCRQAAVTTRQGELGKARLFCLPFRECPRLPLACHHQLSWRRLRANPRLTIPPSISSAEAGSGICEKV